MDILNSFSNVEILNELISSCLYSKSINSFNFEILLLLISIKSSTLPIVLIIVDKILWKN